MNINRSALASAFAAACLTASVSVPANAQSVVKKHPIATGVVAGAVAHHMAAKGAKSRAAAGKKPTLAERHPIATGVAAGVVAHHLAKKSK